MRSKARINATTASGRLRRREVRLSVVVDRAAGDKPGFSTWGRAAVSSASHWRREGLARRDACSTLSAPQLATSGGREEDVPAPVLVAGAPKRGASLIPGNEGGDPLEGASADAGSGVTG